MLWQSGGNVSNYGKLKRKQLASLINRRAAWPFDTPKQMKANKVKTATAAAVSIVREAGNIESMFKRNSLGYLTSDKASNDISVEDGIGYIVTKLEAGQSANRQAILFAAWVFKTKTAEEGKTFAEKLKDRWAGSTIDNLLSISRALPTFEKSGLNIESVRDIYGLRECSKLLKGEDTSKQAVALLNKGESPRNVKEKLNPKQEAEPKQESAPVLNEADQQQKLEVLILSYVETLAKLADSDSRLKIARQIVSKLHLGNYILGHTDAIKAIQDLKAKK